MAKERSRFTPIGERSLFYRHFDILGKADFSSLIRRERERADRSHEVFSLALFDVDSSSDSQMRSQQARIRKSMRSIDQVGWMGDKSLGVFLPATSNEGARIFAGRVAASLASHKIFTYPENWIPEYMAKSRSPLEMSQASDRAMGYIFLSISAMAGISRKSLW